MEGKEGEHMAFPLSLPKEVLKVISDSLCAVVVARKRGGGRMKESFAR